MIALHALLNLWRSPRATMRRVLEGGFAAWPLAFGNALILTVAALQKGSAAQEAMGPTWLVLIGGMCVLYIGLSMLFVPAFFYWLLAKLLKCPATFKNLQRAVTWGMFPFCVVSAVGIPLWAYGKQLVLAGQWMILLPLALPYLVLWVWTVIIFLKATGEVLQKNVWWSLGIAIVLLIPQSVLMMFAAFPLFFMGVVAGRVMVELCNAGAGFACAAIAEMR